MVPRRTGKLFGFFDDMEREIDMAFEDLLSSHPMWDSATGRLEPLTQVRETLNKVVVTMDLPMVHKEDIHLTIEEDHLELQAPLDHCVRYEHWGIQGHSEFKSFYKIVALPSRVNPEEAKARFRNGVLMVELPKTIKGRKIPVE